MTDSSDRHDKPSAGVPAVVLVARSVWAVAVVPAYCRRWVPPRAMPTSSCTSRCATRSCWWRFSVVMLFVLVVVFGPLLTSAARGEQCRVPEPPSAQHWLGTTYSARMSSPSSLYGILSFRSWPPRRGLRRDRDDDRLCRRLPAGWWMRSSTSSRTWSSASRCSLIPPIIGGYLKVSACSTEALHDSA